MNIEADFPGLAQIAYLDSAATSQKPECVIAAMTEYYRQYCANVHRGAYRLSERATASFEQARDKVAKFLGTSPRQCIFTRGTTESLNMLASGLCSRLEPGQRIALSTMEHHSNLIPWQMAAERHKLVLDWIEVTSQGKLDPASLEAALERKPAILTLTWVSNVLGTINPIADIAQRCREIGTILVVDGAQGVPHLPCDVQELGCHFLAFSGHKMLGPTGIGILWGRLDALESLPPFQYGGSMIESVRREKTTFTDLPQRLEAGTPPIAEAIGLGAAIDYLQNLGMASVRQHEVHLLRYTIDGLKSIEGVELEGPQNPQEQSGLVSFRLQGIHPHDAATILDRLGVCVRAGHHCCQPLMRTLADYRTPGSRAGLSLLRASFYVYNRAADVDRLLDGLRETRKVLLHG